MEDLQILHKEFNDAVCSRKDVATNSSMDIKRRTRNDELNFSKESSDHSAFLSRWRDVTYTPKTARKFSNALSRTDFKSDEVVSDIQSRTDFKPDDVVSDIKSRTDFKPDDVVSDIQYRTDFKPDDVVSDIKSRTDFKPDDVVSDIQSRTDFKPDDVVSDIQSRTDFKSNDVLTDTKSDLTLIFSTCLSGHLFMLIAGISRLIFWNDNMFFWVPLMISSFLGLIDCFRITRGILLGRAGLSEDLTTFCIMMSFSTTPLLWISFFEIISLAYGLELPVYVAKVLSVTFCINGFNNFVAELDRDYPISKCGAIWRHTLRRKYIPLSYYVNIVSLLIVQCIFGYIIQYNFDDSLPLTLAQITLLTQVYLRSAFGSELLEPYLKEVSGFIGLANLVYIYYKFLISIDK